MTFILQQDDAAARRLQRQLTSLRIVERNTRIGLLAIEEAELDRLAQNSSDLVIDRRLRDLTRFDRGQERRAIHEFRRRHLEIETAVGCAYTVIRRVPV